jgi:ABC-type antimicrobial peptide transport system, ATPase component
MGVLVDLNGVSKSFKRGGQAISIFDGLSMQIEDDDFIAIMGPSGSGKSTLLNMLGGSIGRAPAPSPSAMNASTIKAKARWPNFAPAISALFSNSII